MRLNLSEIEDRSFEALPSGKYVVRFDEYEEKETKGGEDAKLPKGTPMIMWTLEVLRSTSGDETYKGRKLFTNSILHENTMWNIKATLKAAGWTDEQLNDPDGVEFDPPALIGNECIAVVGQRTYDGDLVNNVKRLAPLGSETADAGAGSVLP